MRDPAALLTSLVAVERQQLLAILDAEKRAAEHLSRTTPQRTPKQRVRGEEAARRAARLAAMLAYFRGGAIEDLSAADLWLCPSKLFSERLKRGAQERGPASDAPAGF